jgi:hypothetical protein
MNNAHQSQMKKQKNSVAWKSGPSRFYDFGGSKVLEENRQKKSNHQTVTNRQKKRTVMIKEQL